MDTDKPKPQRLSEPDRLRLSREFDGTAGDARERAAILRRYHGYKDAAEWDRIAKESEYQ